MFGWCTSTETVHQSTSTLSYCFRTLGYSCIAVVCEYRNRKKTELNRTKIEKSKKTSPTMHNILFTSIAKLSCVRRGLRPRGSVSGGNTNKAEHGHRSRGQRGWADQNLEWRTVMQIVLPPDCLKIPLRIHQNMPCQAKNIIFLLAGAQLPPQTAQSLDSTTCTKPPGSIRSSPDFHFPAGVAFCWLIFLGRKPCRTSHMPYYVKYDNIH